MHDRRVPERRRGCRKPGTVSPSLSEILYWKPGCLFGGGRAFLFLYYRKSPKLYEYDDERIREALNAPIEEREKMELPKTIPLEQLERCRLKPLPAHSKKGTIPR